MKEMVDIHVGVWGIGGTDFVFEIPPGKNRVRFEEDRKKGILPRNLMLSFDDNPNMKVKEIGNVILRTVAQTLTGIKRCKARFRVISRDTGKPRTACTIK
jgi:hypothetical protein